MYIVSQSSCRSHGVYQNHMSSCSAFPSKFPFLSFFSFHLENNSEKRNYYLYETKYECKEDECIRGWILWGAINILCQWNPLPSDRCKHSLVYNT